MSPKKPGRSDGEYIGIYTPKSVYLKFFIWLFCLLDPAQIHLYPPKSNSWLRPCKKLHTHLSRIFVTWKLECRQRCMRAISWCTHKHGQMQQFVSYGWKWAPMCLKNPSLNAVSRVSLLKLWNCFTLHTELRFWQFLLTKWKWCFRNETLATNCDKNATFIVSVTT